MAWSGPQMGGSAPTYQQPPQYGNGQPSYGTQQTYPQPPQGQQQYPPQTQPYSQQQPPYQAGSYSQPQYPQSAPPHSNHSNHPPNSYPPKRKGNPVITRYPPPPGYRGPTPNQQSSPSYGQNQYQQPQGYQQQSYPPPQGQPPPPQGYPPPPPNYQQPAAYPPAQGYPQQAPYPQQPPYQAPPNYPQGYQQPPASGYQQAYQQPPNYPAQQGYPPNQGYQQPATGYQQPPPPPPQGYPQQGAYQQPPQGGYPPQPDPNNYPTQNPQWSQHPPQPPYPPGDQYAPYGAPPPSGPSPSQDPNATPTSGPAQSAPTQQQSTPTQNPPPDSEGNSNKPEETKHLYLAWDDWDFDFDGALWPKGNDSIDTNLSIGIIIWHPANQVTRALPSTFADAEEQGTRNPAKKLGNGESTSLYFTLENSHEAFLNIRQTDSWHYFKNDPIFTEFPKKFELIPLEDVLANRDRPDLTPEEMAMGTSSDSDAGQDSGWNVMDNLEQALTAQTPISQNQEQEDILAKLGVTGAPKPVVQTPGRPILPPGFLTVKDSDTQDQDTSKSATPKNNSSGGFTAPPPPLIFGPGGSPPQPPPPPERMRSPSYDPWTAGPNGHRSYDGVRDSPARSEATQAGSDFNMDNEPANETPTMKTDDGPSKSQSSTKQSPMSRKRSYDDSEDGRSRQFDDVTPRLKRRQPQVAAAYSRRW